jgi:(hydroxyamino)benzene mutase
MLADMLEPVLQLRQGYRLLQIGLTLFLITSFEGFAIPYFGAPRLGLSVHSLSALLGVMLLIMGLLWPRLTLTAAESRMAFWCLIYSTLAIVVAFQLESLWGVNTSTMLVAYSSAPAGVASFGLILRGFLPRPLATPTRTVSTGATTGRGSASPLTRVGARN